MHVAKDHLYHGAALVQIAEHPKFTAINSVEVEGTRSRSAFHINTDIGVYCKYVTTKTRRYDEHVFKFTDANLAELNAIGKKLKHVFLALVCVPVSEICCVPLVLLNELHERRRSKESVRSPTFDVLVVAHPNKSFRVSVNLPGRRGKMIGKASVISRTNFPAVLFANEA